MFNDLYIISREKNEKNSLATEIDFRFVNNVYQIMRAYEYQVT